MDLETILYVSIGITTLAVGTAAATILYTRNRLSKPKEWVTEEEDLAHTLEIIEAHEYRQVKLTGTRPTFGLLPYEAEKLRTFLPTVATKIWEHPNTKASLDVLAPEGDPGYRQIYHLAGANVFLAGANKPLTIGGNQSQIDYATKLLEEHLPLRVMGTNKRYES